MGRILKVPEPDTSKKACKYQLQHCCGAIVEIESNELERPKSMNWDGKWSTRCPYCGQVISMTEVEWNEKRCE